MSVWSTVHSTSQSQVALQALYPSRLDKVADLDELMWHREPWVVRAVLIEFDSWMTLADADGES